MAIFAIGNDTEAHKMWGRFTDRLGSPGSARYLEKLRFIGGADRYTLAPLFWINDNGADDA